MLIDENRLDYYIQLRHNKGTEMILISNNVRGFTRVAEIKDSQGKDCTLHIADRSLKNFRASDAAWPGVSHMLQCAITSKHKMLKRFYLWVDPSGDSARVDRIEKAIAATYPSWEWAEEAPANIL